jgi:hypothetical protein
VDDRAVGESSILPCAGFLFDRRSRYSVPLTIFGPKRAAIYIGNMYFVLNSTEHIRALTRHFDDLIRVAVAAAAGIRIELLDGNWPTIST